MATLPNAIELSLRLSVGVEAFSWRETAEETPPATAVRAAVCAVLTAATVAVNAAVVAPAATVTDAGTVTALLLLDRVTVAPPLGAAAFRVTEQESEPEPVNDAVAQENALSVATPVPLRLTAVVAPEDALLETVS
jgi:hypothetical protein